MLITEYKQLSDWFTYYLNLIHILVKFYKIKFVYLISSYDKE